MTHATTASPRPQTRQGIDPRLYQIGILTALLIYGIGWLEFDISIFTIVFTIAIAQCTSRSVRWKRRIFLGAAASLIRTSRRSRAWPRTPPAANTLSYRRLSSLLNVMRLTGSANPWGVTCVVSRSPRPDANRRFAAS